MEWTTSQRVGWKKASNGRLGQVMSSTLRLMILRDSPRFSPSCMFFLVYPGLIMMVKTLWSSFAPALRWVRHVRHVRGLGTFPKAKAGHDYTKLEEELRFTPGLRGATHIACFIETRHGGKPPIFEPILGKKLPLQVRWRPLPKPTRPVSKIFKDLVP